MPKANLNRTLRSSGLGYGGCGWLALGGAESAAGGGPGRAEYRYPELGRCMADNRARRDATRLTSQWTRGRSGGAAQEPAASEPARAAGRGGDRAGALEIVQSARRRSGPSVCRLT